MYIAQSDTRPLPIAELSEGNAIALQGLWDLTEQILQADRRQETVSRVMFLDGERGQGKTTVLLTAQAALHRPDWFTSSKAPQTRRIRELSRSVVWLSPLDLGDLDTGANLLSTILLCVHKALSPLFHQAGLSRPSALSVKTPIQDLLRLIYAAQSTTPSPEKGPEERIAATESLMTFTGNLREVISGLASEHGQRYGDGNPSLIVLPIDNVDLYPDHARAIEHTLRKAFVPNLAFVLAGSIEGLQDQLVHQKLRATPHLSLVEGGVIGARRSAIASIQRLVPMGHIVRFSS